MTWLTVYRKELRETLRDRRTLAVMVLLPLILYPLMAVLAAEWFISHEASRQARPSPVLLGGAGAEALRAPLAAEGAPIKLMVAPDVAVDWSRGPAALAELGVDAALVVPAPDESIAASERTVTADLYWDPSDDASGLAKQRIDAAIAAFADAEVARRLDEEGLPPAFVRPVALTSVSLASRGKVGRAEAAKTLPFVIVLMVLMGAFYPAIDLTAGEKERGTLEPLLATPAPRRAIMSGKLLAVATISALTGLLNLICMAAAALWIARSAARSAGASLPLGELLGALPWGAVGLSLLALLVATLLFSGMMVAVAALARGFKEAQNFLTPVYLVATMPAMVSWLPGTELGYGSAILPVANVTLLLKGAVAGTLEVGPAALALVASVTYAWAAMSLAARVYDSERLLFAPEAAPGGGLLARLFGRAPDAGMAAPAGADRQGGAGAPLEAAEAMALFAVCALLLFGPGGELQAQGLGGVAASLWLCLALPVWLFTRWRRGRVAPALGLTRPTPRHLAGAVLIGCSAWLALATLILPLQEALFPTPPQLEEALEGLIAPEAPLALTMIAIAISPAVCEELLCRGAVARSLDRVLGRGGAVVVSALLFAALHLSAYRFLPTFLLGLLLAAVALYTGCLWLAMIVHALNNAAVVFLSSPAGAPIADWMEEQLWLGGVAIALLATGIALILQPKRLQS